MWKMEKKILDYLLVPLGLLILLAYHIWLLRQIIRRPTTTIVGINAINRHLWVLAMMQDTSKNGVLAVQTLRNNIMASTLLASTAIMLSSLIAVLMTSKNGPIGVVYGDVSELGLSVKFFSILVCFLLAFLFNVQSIRFYSHASMLINVPSKRNISCKDFDVNDCGGYMTSRYVWRTVNRGSYYWSLGLRAFYFSLPLFLWIFGPIPLFISCILLVFMLYNLDVTFDFGEVVSSDTIQPEGNKCMDEELNVDTTTH